MTDIDMAIRPAQGAPASEQEKVRAQGPVVWSDALNGWVVSSYDDAKRVVSDAAAFSNENTPIADAFSPYAMLVMDTPLHHKIRAVWAKPASLSAATGKVEDFERISTALLTPVAAALAAGQTVNLVPVFEAFTTEVITMLMDLSSDHRDKFQLWNRKISDNAMLMLEPDDPRYAEREGAKEEVYAFLREEVERRRTQFAAGEQPADLLSMMLVAEGQNGITPQIALGNILNLFTGALDTTVRWLGNCLVVLDRHPEIEAEVRHDRALLPQALEEVMRYESVVQITLRIVKEDCLFHNQPLKAGDFIYALIGAANRDPAVFEAPGAFDIHRKPKLQLGFGFGMHQCLGMNIARKEVQTFIGRMFDMLPPLDIVDCDYGTTWSLWGPLVLNVRAANTG